MNTRSLIILDDERDFRGVCYMLGQFPEQYNGVDLIITRNKEDFFSALDKFAGDYSNLTISWDHDLGLVSKYGNEINGKTILADFIHLLMKNNTHPSKFPEMRFHSANPVGVGNMISLWNSFLKSVN